MLTLVVILLCILIGIGLSLIFKPKKYQGEMLVKYQEDGKLTYSLEINENPDGFQHMKEIRFKVVKEDAQDIHSI